MKKRSLLILLLCVFTTVVKAQIKQPIVFKRKSHFLLDYAPGAASVAFSVSRKINRNYNGPLFRAVRISDSAKMDIPSLNNSVDFTFLRNFIGTSDAKVVKLYDQSGNGNDATLANPLLGGTIATAGVLNLSVNTQRLRMTIGTNQQDSYYRLTNDVINPDFSGLYVGKADQVSAPSLGVAGSGSFTPTPAISAFSLNLSTSKANTKLGLTIYYVRDYPSTFNTPIFLSSILWTKANLSANVFMYLNGNLNSVTIDNGARVFLLRRIIDNSIISGTQDFQEFVYYNKVLTATERVNSLNNIKQYFVTP